MAGIVDVSESLDVIGSIPGYTLIRGEKLWGAGPFTTASPAATRCEISADVPCVQAATPMIWTGTSLATASAWDPTKPTRLTIPHGITKARIEFSARNSSASSASFGVHIRKNGTEFIASSQCASGYTNQAGYVGSGMMSVTEGDYFEALTQLSDAAGKSWTAQRCWFSGEFYT